MNDAEEKRLLDELAELAKSSEYIHVIAYLAFQSNYLMTDADSVNTESMFKSEMGRNVLRQEISVLMHNLYVYNTNYKVSKINLNLIKEQVKKTVDYLHRIRAIYSGHVFSEVAQHSSHSSFKLPITSLHEELFYGSDCASDFQYAEAAMKKYANDYEWLVMNKGFNMSELEKFVNAVYTINRYKTSDVSYIQEAYSNKIAGCLSMFLISMPEITACSELDAEIINDIIKAFCIDEQNESKTHLIKINQVNPINAFPLFRLNDSELLCFQPALLKRAMFYTPFYWFNKDKQYKKTADINRGNFAENTAYEYIKSIFFGYSNTYQNIKIYRGKKIIGEMDVLVTFGDVLFMFEVKAKALTYQARMGDSIKIIEDFKKGVQKSYDQAYQSAEFLLNGNCRLLTSAGGHIDIQKNIKEIYLFSILAEDYPALLYMENELLEYSQTAVIRPPCVIDIFALQSMAEILQCLLYFYDYTVKRAMVEKNIKTRSHESDLLTLYVHTGLVDVKERDIVLTPDLALENDLMLRKSREENINIDVSTDILQRVCNKPAYKKIVESISRSMDYHLIKAGLFLLSLNNSQIEQLNSDIENTGNREGFSYRFGSTGFSLMRSERDAEDYRVLFDICSAKKHEHQLQSWHGLCISTDGLPKYAIYLNY